MTRKDREHLRLLSIFHYIMAGLGAFFSCFPLIYVVIGIAMISSPQKFPGNGQQPPPAVLGWFFVVLGAAAILLGWILAFCLFLSGRFLAQRKHYVYCLVIAGLSFLQFPLGTILGIFTIVVLSRPSIRARFRASLPPDPLPVAQFEEEG